MSEEDLPPVERELLRQHLAVLQEPLPLVPEPYAAYAEKLGTSQEAVFELLCEYLQRKMIRRIAGVLKHNKAGFTENAMVAVEVPLGKCDEIGKALAAFPFVSHCYRRTAYPDWPYTVYAMLHAKNPEEFDECIAKVKDSVQGCNCLVLKSVKEFKKTAFRVGVE